LTVNSDATVDGSLIVGADIDATGDVDAQGRIGGGTVQSQTTVIAGAGDISEPGYVQAKAGESARVFKASGSGNVVTGTGNATLEGDALNAANDYVKIICSGTTTSQSPTFNVTVGGVNVFTCSTLRAPSAGTYKYYIEVLVFRLTATTAQSTGFVSWNPGTASASDLIITSGSDQQGVSITWASSNTIAHSASATNTKSLTMYEIYPAT
jgi:hypothetical protein